MQFPQILVRHFEKTASKQFRYDAEADAPAAAWGLQWRRLLWPDSLPKSLHSDRHMVARPC